MFALALSLTRRKSWFLGGIMRTVTLLLVLGIVSGPALAQTQPEPPKSTLVKPVSAGQPHICLSYYPQAALRERREGGVLVAFVVTADGTVDAVTVVASSGSYDLDVASTRCASKWLYKPGNNDGVAVNTPWYATVSWALGNESKHYAVPKPTGDISSCVRAYPDAAKHAVAVKTGISVVGYTLANGVVTEALLKGSSADDVLDQDAIACVKGWTFKPDYENGQPATGNHLAIIDWKQAFLPSR
jgi:TonB family protein